MYFVIKLPKHHCCWKKVFNIKYVSILLSSNIDIGGIVFLHLYSLEVTYWSLPSLEEGDQHKCDS